MDEIQEEGMVFQVNATEKQITFFNGSAYEIYKCLGKILESEIVEDLDTFHLVSSGPVQQLTFNDLFGPIEGECDGPNECGL